MHTHSSRDGLVQEGKRSADQMEPRVHADPQLQVCQCSPCDVAGKPVQVQMLIPLVSSTLALCTKQALDDELRDAEQIPAC